MVDWLPDEHLVWFVLDTVAVLDTAALHARVARRRDGGARRSAAGRAGYDPEMLLGLLLYAYCRGQRSSRQIERLCATDVAFRVACAGDVPDHTVLARFRQAHSEVFAGLFAQVLRLCRDAGMARLGTVAIDGTKIAANASRQANRHETGWPPRSNASTSPTPTRPTPTRPEGGSGRWPSRSSTRPRRSTRPRTSASGSRLAGTSGPGMGWTRRAAGTDPGRGRADRRRGRRPRGEDRAGSHTHQPAREPGTGTRRTGIGRRARRAARQDRCLGTGLGAGHRHLRPRTHGRAPRPIEEASGVRRARERVERARHRLADPDTAPRPGRQQEALRPARAPRPGPARTGEHHRPGLVADAVHARLAPVLQRPVRRHRRPAHPRHRGRFQPRRCHLLRRHGRPRDPHRRRPRRQRRGRHPAVRRRLRQRAHPQPGPHHRQYQWL
ncbi:transposase [Pseudonocardia alni]|uniref:Transposase n=1 Tax=Pseudonocardia alni subsp. carboxydivorans TaxID=415010 RepID=A0ABU9ALH7_PSEA5